jgi:hypothetical protein
MEWLNLEGTGDPKKNLDPSKITFALLVAVEALEREGLNPALSIWRFLFKSGQLSDKKKFHRVPEGRFLFSLCSVHTYPGANATTFEFSTETPALM